jgi:hypothetical protein
MIGTYILDGKTPKQVPFEEWSIWFLTTDRATQRLNLLGVVSIQEM